MKIMSNDGIELMDISSDNLRGANLSNAKLCSANLSGADLYSADLYGANLCSANLSGANLSGANLCSANLSGANLSSADLCSANLSGANLSGADLYSADLYGANLCSANLSGANLSGANLCSANLFSANLSGAKGITNPIDYISQFKSDSLGIIVYKSFGENYSNNEWKIEVGSVITETVNPNRTNDCGCGINFATLEWCKKNCSRPVWKCRIAWIDLVSVVVPYNTEGKARCGRMTILEKVN